jgi:hypothetical protein
MIVALAVPAARKQRAVNGPMDIKDRAYFIVAIFSARIVYKGCLHFNMRGIKKLMPKNNKEIYGMLLKQAKWTIRRTTRLL